MVTRWDGNYTRTVVAEFLKAVSGKAIFHDLVKS